LLSFFNPTLARVIIHVIDTPAQQAYHLQDGF